MKRKRKTMLIICAFPYHTQNGKKKIFYFQMPEALYTENAGEGRTFDAFKTRGLSSSQRFYLSRGWDDFPYPRTERNIPEEQCRASSCPELWHLREMSQ